MNITRLSEDDKNRMRNEFEWKLFRYANNIGLKHRIIVNAHELGYVVLFMGKMGWATTWFDNIITID